MAISGKYGKVNIPRIGTDEPVFILRAQDKLAEAAIEMYKALAASHGSSLAKDIQKEIDAFKNWGGRKKTPDWVKILPEKTNSIANSKRLKEENNESTG